MELNYKELVMQLKACVFTVIYPELAGNAATAIQLLTERLAEYERLGFTPEDIAYMAKFFKERTSAEAIATDMKVAAKLIEWAKWKDLEEQRRLIIIPCKIGDTVYRVCKKKYDVDGYGMQWEEDWGIVTNAFHLGMFHEIGKTVFLTREEAEENLKDKQK